MEQHIRIAAVDDEPIFTAMVKETIEAHMKNAGEDYKMQIFSGGNELLSSDREKPFDLVLLDIDMPQITGIEIARELRMKREDTAIIFVTNKDELVYETIQYTPFRFIRKSRFSQEISEALENYLRKRREQKAVYFFSVDDGKRPVNVVSLIYAEVQSHKLTVHCEEESFEANGNLSDVEKAIAGYGFVRIHKSYLVNLRYISLIRKSEIILDDGTSLPLSRRKLESVKMELVRFARGI